MRSSRFFNLSDGMRKIRLCPLMCLAFVFISWRSSALGEPTARASFTREAMLRELAGNVVAPGWQDLALRCRDLTNSVRRLLENPAPPALEQARQAWLEASLAAARMRCFQAGPIADRGCVSTFYYWQVMPNQIQTVLAASDALDEAYLDQLGATTKGLFAVEFLLFEMKSGDPNVSGKMPLILNALSGPKSKRYRDYLFALAQELERKATLVAKDWTAPGAQAASGKFAAGGQESMNVLVNRLAAGIEDAAERHLHFVLVLPTPILLSRVERSRSGSSLAGVQACLEGAQALFNGRGGGLGLKDAVKQVNPGLEKRLTEQFEAAIRATRDIGMPLEEAAINNRAALEKAYEEARKLEVLLKVDVVSALGVTLTFSSNDGD